MATTIAQSFRIYLANLEITDLQATTVSTRQNNVRDALAQELTVLDSFLAGSYARNTMIAPLAEADIDIFCVLHPQYYQGATPASLLDRVKRALQRTYPKTPDISRNGQAVTITFTDFIVDVVPAFNRNGGGYLIPDSLNNAWLPTDPKRHITLSTQANTAHNGDLVPTEKALKGWNREINRYFRSFHLEVLAWEIFANIRIDSYSSAVRFFFDKTRAKIPNKQLDPAGYGDDVGRYITSTEVPNAVSRLDTALGRALKAEEYERNGRTAAAVEEWRKIFGDRFPVYG